MPVGGADQPRGLRTGVRLAPGDLGELGVHDGLELVVACRLTGEQLIEAGHRPRPGDAVMLIDLSKHRKVLVDLELPHRPRRLAAIVAVNANGVAQVGQGLLNGDDGGGVIRHVDLLVSVGVEPRGGHPGAVETLLELWQSDEAMCRDGCHGRSQVRRETSTLRSWSQPRR